jgi:hypothetical protein
MTDSKNQTFLKIQKPFQNERVIFNMEGLVILDFSRNAHEKSFSHRWMIILGIPYGL